VNRHIKATVSPAILLCGTSVFDTLVIGVQYVVGKGKVLCDALREFKLLDCLNLLLFVQYTYTIWIYIKSREVQ
jgi:hypothetical protein